MSTNDGLLRAELTARIASNEATIAAWSNATNPSPFARRSALADTGFSWFDIATCRVLLGEGAAALEAFAHAAEWMHASLAVVSPPTLATYVAALESAVLSGDRALALRQAAEPVAPEPRPSLVRDRLAWGLALPALVTHDDDVVAAQVAAAREVPDAKAWYPGIGDALQAFVDGDADELRAALGRMLEKHVRYARSTRSHCFNWGPCLMCVPAAVLLRLARARGLGVDEVDGRRATIPFKLLFSTDPAETVSLDVDFLAPASLSSVDLLD